MTIQPLVLLNGLLCDSAVWASQTTALADVARCDVPDLTRDDTMAAMAARVLAEVPFERFALAGFSMGGYCAFEIMRQAPGRVTRLALMDTSPHQDDDERRAERERFVTLAGRGGFMPITRLMVPSLVHPSRVDDEPVVRVIREMGERVGAAAYVRQQKAIMSRADSVATLPRIACPTLVLCGEQDTRTTLAPHELMAREIPDARLVTIPDCGHMVTLERPEAVTAAMRAWLVGDQGPHLVDPPFSRVL
jgi:pimeloyl-ACP methyl ester carboxylesterase